MSPACEMNTHAALSLILKTSTTSRMKSFPTTHIHITCMCRTFAHCASGNACDTSRGRHACTCLALVPSEQLSTGL